MKTYERLLKNIIITNLIVLFFCNCISVMANNVNSSDSVKIEKALANINHLWNLCSCNKAIDEIHQIMPLVVKTYGKDSDKYGQLLELAASIMVDNDEYNQGIKLIDERIRQLTLRNEFEDPYAKALSIKALLLFQTDNATEALALFGQAIGIFKRNGNKSIDYLRTIKDYSIAYNAIGDYDTALDFLSEAYFEVLSTPNLILCDDVAAIRREYASALFEKGEKEKALTIAENLYEELEESQICLGAKILTLMNLSVYNEDIKDYNSCIYYGQLADSLLSSIDSNVGYNKGTTNLYLGLGYEGLNDYDKAKEHYRESLKYRESTFGYNHSYTIGTLWNLLRLHIKCGEEEEAVSSIISLADREGQSFLNTFAELDNDSQKKYWEEYESDWYLSDLPSLCVRYNNPIINELTYNGLLLSKSILLDSEIHFNQYIKSSSNTSFYNRYIHLKNEIENNYSDSLRIEERKLRKEILASTDYMNIFKTTWNDVRSSLPDNSVAIEFFCIDVDDNTNYYSMIVDKFKDTPILVKLCSSEDISKIGLKRIYDNNSLSKLLWEPIIENIPSDTKRIYFSPSGDLFNMSIENLQHPIDPVYMSDKYDLYRVTSTREVANLSSKGFILSATLIGGIDYESVEETTPIISDEENTYSHYTKENLRGGYSKLPATSIEITEAEKELMRLGVEINIGKGTTASKQFFLSLQNNVPSILHIATHGFFNSKKLRNNQNEEEVLSLTEDDISLLKSGFLLAGANESLKKNKSVFSSNSGIMTAYEVSKMDLFNLDLVILSACQTGLGEIRGDGVFGLQRGFKKAGAKSIMMSLWKVDDDATQLLMSNFYKYYIQTTSVHDSLEKAKAVVRNFNGLINGKKRNFSNPKYWAAFVLLDATT